MNEKKNLVLVRDEFLTESLVFRIISQRKLNVLLFLFEPYTDSLRSAVIIEELPACHNAVESSSG